MKKRLPSIKQLLEMHAGGTELTASQKEKLTEWSSSSVGLKDKMKRLDMELEKITKIKSLSDDALAELFALNKTEA